MKQVKVRMMSATHVTHMHRLLLQWKLWVDGSRKVTLKALTSGILRVYERLALDSTTNEWSAFTQSKQSRCGPKKRLDKHTNHIRRGFVEHKD